MLPLTFFIANKMKKITKNQRIPIGKTLRFKIFKRDMFACQYCGQTPPSVVLEVDHIVPVSKGGDNNELNLLTSCFDCNRGKRDTLLTTLPESKNIELIQEKEEQYLAFKKLMLNISKRINKEINQIDLIFSDGFDGKCSLSDSFKNTSLKNFINKLGYYEVEDAMYKSINKGLYRSDTVKYFCGICHNKIKNR